MLLQYVSSHGSCPWMFKDMFHGCGGEGSILSNEI